MAALAFNAPVVERMAQIPPAPILPLYVVSAFAAISNSPVVGFGAMSNVIVDVTLMGLEPTELVGVP